MPMIRETLVVTKNDQGVPHIAPMGAQTLTLADGTSGVLLQPFRPSTTLDNLTHGRCASLNHVDDVRIIAGCLTGHRDWPLLPCKRIACPRLAAALSHVELELEHIDDDLQRPKFYLRVIGESAHAPYPGFNRAKAAIIETAILVSRLHMLPKEKIDSELEYLRIAIDKTAGAEEMEAWEWLCETIALRRSQVK